jgi:hypothetical protein
VLAKLTSKNQITIPAELLKQVPTCDYFEATVERGAILLRPVIVRPAVHVERIRDTLAEAGLTEADVRDAVRWARRPR